LSEGAATLAIVSDLGVQAQLASLWAKSPEKASGRMSVLVQHLLDTGAVAELLWDEFMPRPLQTALDDCSADGSSGRVLFTMLAALHDVGKATPGFQSKHLELAARVAGTGLPFPSGLSAGFRHELAVPELLGLAGAGWPRNARNWVLPLMTGHHGLIRSAGANTGAGDVRLGGPAWAPVQSALITRVVAAWDLSLDAGIAPRHPPRVAHQLAAAGLVIACDWIASSMPGHDDATTAGVGLARERARSAWTTVGLRRGWHPTMLSTADDLVRLRFGGIARPVQTAAVAAARSAELPGLLLIEAPMGEGKTEAALAAVEVLARRSGSDGVFVAMPTQATGDAMLDRVLPWARQLADGAPVALLHGKRRFSEAWRLLRQEQVVVTGIDDLGMPDDYGTGAGDGAVNGAGGPSGGVVAASEWLLGSKRGLLTPIVVGTIDHLLLAATSTRHVALRMAGLVGKVVVLDEVHAYDRYMTEFLCEALRWLADAGVPVVLLSATLAPAQRRELLAAYDRGLGPAPDRYGGGPEPSGYPSVISLDRRGVAFAEVRATAPWRSSVRTAVVTPGGDPREDPERVAALLVQALAGGGCALVVLNTVDRAQTVWRALHPVFGSDLRLLHARMPVADRAARSARVLAELGPPGGPVRRPERLVVVATQVAEQSFDVDADLLVTDLAPVDLLLQRAGRLHRHERAPGARPALVASPRVVVIGHAGVSEGLVLERGATYVYGETLLRRSAELVAAATTSGWSVPADVPRLVAQGYADLDEAWLHEQDDRADQAKQHRLSERLSRRPRNLNCLHEGAGGDAPEPGSRRVLVRDGEQGLEVALVRATSSGLRTLAGRALGVHGEAVSDPDLAEEVAGSSLRLSPGLTREAGALRPLPGWTADPWLCRVPALVLDEDSRAAVGNTGVRYDDDLGLVVEQS